MNGPDDDRDELGSHEPEARMIAGAITLLRRGRSVERQILEVIFGRDVATWISLRHHVSDDAVREAMLALNAGESDRVRVIVSVLPQREGA